MADNYLSFEEAMDTLGISQDELEELVGEGKLRAFRVGGETKFKEADVQELAEQSTDATFLDEGDIELAEDTADDLLEAGTEEIVFEDDVDEDAVTAEFEADDASTQELTLDEGNVFDAEEEIATEQVDLDEAFEETGGRPASSRRSSARASRRIAEFPIDKPPTWITVMLVSTVVILIITTMVYFQQIRYRTERSKIPGHLKFFTDMFNPGGE